MATRLYVVPSLAPSISPATDVEWDQTAQGVRRVLTADTSGLVAASEQVAAAETSASSTHDVLLAQLISPPLAGAQTITGTLNGRIRAQESATDADMRAQLIARVVSGDGATVRGTLLAADAGALANELATSFTARAFPRGGPVTLTSVAAQDGDRIVIEVGYRAHNTLTASRTGTIELRVGAAADLAANETDTSASNSWLEFSQDLTFAREVQITSHVVEVGEAPTARDVQISAHVVEVGEAPTARDVQISAHVVEVAIAEDWGWWDIGMDADPG
jgi:hypothetical protein